MAIFFVAQVTKLLQKKLPNAVQRANCHIEDSLANKKYNASKFYQKTINKIESKLENIVSKVSQNVAQAFPKKPKWSPCLLYIYSQIRDIESQRWGGSAAAALIA